MFCSKCGNQMNDNERFCAKCGNNCAPQQEEKTTTSSQPATKQTQAPAQAQSVQQPTQQAQVAIQPNTSTKTNTIPKKKSKKPLIAVIAIVLVVAIVIGIIFMVPKGGGTTVEINTIMTNQNGTYYLAGSSCIRVDDSENLQGVMVDNSDDDLFALVANPYQLVSDGNTMYGRINSQSYLSKLTFTDANTVTEEVWIDEDVLDDNDFYAGDFNDFQISGDYIYCICYAYNNGTDYSLVRINKNSDDIEFLNASVYSYVVNGDWIYYCDTGYAYDEDDDEYEYDSITCGIYKMRTDGSNKQLLSDSENNYSCHNFQISGNSLYYISSEDSGKLCRMNLDGTNPESILKKDTISYTIDPGKNKLYYAKGDSSPYTIYEMDLATGEDTKLCKTDCYPSLISVHNNYVYISSSSYSYGSSSSNESLCGERFNFQTGELEKMMGYIDDNGDPVIYLED